MYRSMKDFDKEEEFELEDYDEKMSERFHFSDNEFYSYNQAVYLMGKCLRRLSADTFRVTGRGRLDGKEYLFYEGNNCFYDWFLELDADSLHPYILINFHDKSKGEVYQIERVEDGSYIVCTD